MTFLDNVTVPNNWWGTTDVPTINQTIWDFKNDTLNLGTANFMPILNEPNPTAPSVPTVIPYPTPPPTATPEASPTNSTTSISTINPTEPPTEPSTPYLIPELTPTQTAQVPHGTPRAVIGNFSMSDIDNMLVIVFAIAAAVTIMVIINLKFRKVENRKSSKKHQRRKRRKVFPESSIYLLPSSFLKLMFFIPKQPIMFRLQN